MTQPEQFFTESELSREIQKSMQLTITALEEKYSNYDLSHLIGYAMVRIGVAASYVAHANDDFTAARSISAATESALERVAAMRHEESNDD
tara:strand:+ start:1521 stop:1793 length:273 start_codon:yes stop_codon:yes gene_type:complete